MEICIYGVLCASKYCKISVAIDTVHNIPMQHTKSLAHSAVEQTTKYTHLCPRLTDSWKQELTPDGLGVSVTCFASRTRLETDKHTSV